MAFRALRRRVVAFRIIEAREAAGAFGVEDLLLVPAAGSGAWGARAGRLARPLSAVGADTGEPHPHYGFNMLHQ